MNDDVVQHVLDRLGSDFVGLSGNVTFNFELLCSTVVFNFPLDSPLNFPRWKTTRRSEPIACLFRFPLGSTPDVDHLADAVRAFFGVPKVVEQTRLA